MATYYSGQMSNNELNAYLEGCIQKHSMRHVDAMAHILGFKRSPFVFNDASRRLKDAVIVALDAEWFERGSKSITELGIALTEAQSMTIKPLQPLENMAVRHARIKENAHMVNGKLCDGYPEDFQFGKTGFVSMTEGQDLLRFNFQPYDKNGKLRPVIFLGHAVDNDIEALKQKMSIDISEMGNIVMTLDTQVMAQELNMGGGRKLGLKDILAQYNIEEKYLHNAGNDVVYTMIAACFLASEVRNPNEYRSHQRNQIEVNSIKEQLRNKCRLDFGIATFCTRCDSTEHMVKQCKAKVSCQFCASKPRYINVSHTHKTEKCGVAIRVVVPCQICSTSTDPKRWNRANTHNTEDCRFGVSGSTPIYVTRSFLPPPSPYTLSSYSVCPSPSFLYSGYGYGPDVPASYPYGHSFSKY